MLCVVFVREYLGFIWLPTDRIVSHNVGVFATERDEFFCVVQSRVHESFATQLSSGLEDRPGYRPSDGFEPFPFPSGFLQNQELAELGRNYYAYRAHLMALSGEGLTDIYNRFHDPEEKSLDIFQLRDLHAQMDRAVLRAYGWHDLAETAKCEFVLEYEDHQDDRVESSGRRARKKPWRCRWCDDYRDEVLARLLQLNQTRAQEELRAGGTTTVTKRESSGKKTHKGAIAANGSLFDLHEDTE
jgi:hypothetical protein